jgi:hypothetical protein
MKGNAQQRLRYIADNLDSIDITIMREDLKYGKFSTDVSLSIDHAWRWENSPDKFNMTIRFGKHRFYYSEDQVIYSYWKVPERPEIYDVVNMPNVEKFPLTEESFFQQYTKYDFKDFELEDFQALDKIRRRFQNIWAEYLLRW